MFDLCGFLLFLGLTVFGLTHPKIGLNGFALSGSFSVERLLLLLALLGQQLLQNQLLLLLRVKHFLYLLLVDLKLAITAFAFFSSKLVVDFGVLNLVHGGRIRKVLDLTWRDAFLLLLPLDCIFDGDVLFDSQFPHVLMELQNAHLHILGVITHLFTQLVLVDLYLSILKVLASGNFIGSSLLVDLPVLVASLVPLLHELFVLLHLLESLLSLLLLYALQHAPLGHIVVPSLLLEVSSSHLELQQFLLDILVVLGFDGWTVDTVIFVDGRQFHREVPCVLHLGVND